MTCKISKQWKCDRCGSVSHDLKPKGWKSVLLGIQNSAHESSPSTHWGTKHDVCKECIRETSNDLWFLWIFDRKPRKRPKTSEHDKKIVKELRELKKERESVHEKLEKYRETIKFYTTDDDSGDLARETLNL